MATIQPVATQANFSISRIMSSIGNKAVSLMHSAKENVPHALSTVKDTVVHVASKAWTMLKTIAETTWHYLAVGCAKAASMAKITAASFSATVGPYYPIIATSIISIAIGAGLMYTLQGRI